MKKRTRIRAVTLLSTLILSLTIWGIIGTVRSYNYKMQIDLADKRALFQLSEYLDSIEVSLTKSLYSSSDTMLGSLTARLQRDCSGAKESLSSLSAGETELYNTYRFLSQVGDYTAYLNRKASAGEEITEKDRETVKLLSSFAAGLSLKFEHMTALLSADYFTFDELKDDLSDADTGSETMVSYLDSISDAEMTFENYPTLIYDGPYSDNILVKESELLKGCEEIGIEKAKDIAAKILGVDRKMLVEEEATSGRTAAFCFRTQSYSISITKKGGYPLEIISGISAGEERLSHADALEKASLFLNKLGFSNMVSTYNSANDGIYTVNFAYKDGSFICYPDLIKVSVSLTDGEILAYEATDYIMNHKDRTPPEFGLSPEKAAEDVVSDLSVRKISAAVIPTDDGKEKYTYELLCEDTDGQDILIYKDITTGEEADILILLYSDNGTLTK